MAYIVSEKIIAQPEQSNRGFSFWISENYNMLSYSFLHSGIELLKYRAFL